MLCFLKTPKYQWLRIGMLYMLYHVHVNRPLEKGEVGKLWHMKIAPLNSHIQDDFVDGRCSSFRLQYYYCEQFCNFIKNTDCARLWRSCYLKIRTPPNRGVGRRHHSSSPLRWSCRLARTAPLDFWRLKCWIPLRNPNTSLGWWFQRQQATGYSTVQHKDVRIIRNSGFQDACLNNVDVWYVHVWGWNDLPSIYRTVNRMVIGDGWENVSVIFRPSVILFSFHLNT